MHSIYCIVPCQHSKYCAHNKSHNEGDVLDGIDLHSSCVWIQTEVIREVEAKETAQVEHLCRLKDNSAAIGFRNTLFTLPRNKQQNR